MKACRPAALGELFSNVVLLQYWPYASEESTIIYLMEDNTWRNRGHRQDVAWCSADYDQAGRLVVNESHMADQAVHLFDTPDEDDKGRKALALRADLDKEEGVLSIFLCDVESCEAAY